MFLSDVGGTAYTRPLRCSSVAPGHPSAGAPAIGTFDAQWHGFRTCCLHFAMRITPTPRKTRFQFLVKLYWTGFPR